jgi:dolichol-phosphate mannosyltransferase
MLFVCSPLLNEEKSLEDFHHRLRKNLPPDAWIVFTIDSGSRDGTLDLCWKLTRTDDKLICNHRPYCRNVAEAYVLGLKVAKNSGATEVLEIDAGGGHRPEDIPRFLEVQGCDFVGGNRFMPGGHFTGPKSRKLTSRLGGTLASHLFKIPMGDMTSGFHLYRGEALNRMVSHEFVSQGHFYQTEARSLMKGLPWKEVPITYHAQGGLPNGALGKSLKNLIQVLDRHRL